MLLHVRRANGDGAGGAEDLKELIDAREFGELRHEFIFVDKRKEPTFFQRPNGRLSGFLQRLIDRVAEASSGNDIQYCRKDDQDECESGAVPEREPDAKRHQSTFSIYPLPRIV